jgi:hypothetical protein
MIGFVKSSTILAVLLLSATFAYAGDLKAVHGGGTNVHPAPLHGNDQALTNVSNPTAIEAISKEEEAKLRKLRPVKDDKLRAVK